MNNMDYYPIVKFSLFFLFPHPIWRKRNPKVSCSNINTFFRSYTSFKLLGNAAYYLPLTVSGFSVSVWVSGGGSTWDDTAVCGRLLANCKLSWRFDDACHLLLHLKTSTIIELPLIATPNPANVARRIDRTGCTWTYTQ